MTIGSTIELRRESDEGRREGRPTTAECAAVERILELSLAHPSEGCKFISDDYLHLLEKDQVILSMSDIGRCYDNAMQESFWGTLKTECADRPFPSRAAARQVIFEYIEIWYNRQRRHSALGYLSPAEFEQRARL